MNVLFPEPGSYLIKVINDPIVQWIDLTEVAFAMQHASALELTLKSGQIVSISNRDNVKSIAHALDRMFGFDSSATSPGRSATPGCKCPETQLACTCGAATEAKSSGPLPAGE